MSASERDRVRKTVRAHFFYSLTAHFANLLDQSHDVNALLEYRRNIRLTPRPRQGSRIASR